MAVVDVAVAVRVAAVGVAVAVRVAGVAVAVRVAAAGVAVGVRVAAAGVAVGVRVAAAGVALAAATGAVRFLVLGTFPAPRDRECALDCDDGKLSRASVGNGSPRCIKSGLLRKSMAAHPATLAETKSGKLARTTKHLASETDCIY